MTRIGRLALIGAALALAPGMALAQDMGVGEREFRSNCAPCHGLSGKGDGPYMQYLMDAAGMYGDVITPSVRDLTQLAKQNNGMFPSDRVREVIDGRAEQKAHGQRTMPIWGIEYNQEAAEYFREVWSIKDPESIVKDRINSLVGYVEGLQKM